MPTYEVTVWYWGEDKVANRAQHDKIAAMPPCGKAEWSEFHGPYSEFGLTWGDAVALMQSATGMEEIHRVEVRFVG